MGIDYSPSHEHDSAEISDKESVVEQIVSTTFAGEAEDVGVEGGLRRTSPTRSQRSGYNNGLQSSKIFSTTGKGTISISPWPLRGQIDL